MTQSNPTPDGAACVRCGSALRTDAPFCGSCGQAVITRRIPTADPPADRRPDGAPIVGAGRGVRCAAWLLDVAAMLSPALPLSVVGALLGVAEIIYIVVPVAFVAVWAWMQIWQGYTGSSFGKAMLGARVVRAVDHRPPGLAATLVRSGIVMATAGLAALPVLTDAGPRDGLHDKVSGLTVIDVVNGASPLGPRQVTVLRRPTRRQLNRVTSPVATTGSGRH